MDQDADTIRNIEEIASNFLLVSKISRYEIRSIFNEQIENWQAIEPIAVPYHKCHYDL